MGQSKDTFAFPPLRAAKDQPPLERLERALTRSLRGTDWSGIPDEPALAAALRTYISADQMSDQDRLLLALVEALEAQTADGWRLQLKGARGPRSTFKQQEEHLDLGWCMLERIEAGTGYDSALTEISGKFGCGKTKVAAAYSDIKAWLDSAREAHLDLVWRLLR